MNSTEGNWQGGAELLTTYCQASMPKKAVNKSTAMWRNCASVTSTLWRREERGGERREEEGGERREERGKEGGEKGGEERGEERGGKEGGGERGR